MTEIINAIGEYVTGAGIWFLFGAVLGSFITWSLVAKGVDTRARVLAASAYQDDQYMVRPTRISQEDDLAQ